jgi:TRAP-type uncharacterized transport system substrate-binding protein
MAYIFISSRGGAGDTSKGDQAYEESILSATITGDTTKTLNLFARDGDVVSVSYIDTYVHTQGVPSATWSIYHGMNKYPSVTIVDSAMTEVEGDVEYNSLNAVTITFSGAFSGTAYFN